MNSLENKIFYYDIVEILQNARNQVKKTINNTMTYTYYKIGQRIVEEEQKGKERAEYGKETLKELSKILIQEFGKGFSLTNLKQMRSFYIIYQKGQTLSAELPLFELSWSHYLFLMRLDDENERKFYDIESINNNWSVRELKRQFNTGLYQRLSLSRDKNKIKELSIKGQILESPSDLIKDPLILEFLGFEDNYIYSESELESKIINKLEQFLMELGKGFLFSGRQVRFTFSEKHFKVDLVFYNRILKCFVLIDLKIGELKHQDIGQMQMYVNYYDRKIKLDDENNTIGITLCRDKDNAIVEMTLPENNTHIFASKYQTILPSKEDFKKLIQED